MCKSRVNEGRKLIKCMDALLDESPDLACRSRLSTMPRSLSFDTAPDKQPHLATFNSCASPRPCFPFVAVPHLRFNEHVCLPWLFVDSFFVVGWFAVWCALSIFVFFFLLKVWDALRQCRIHSFVSAQEMKLKHPGKPTTTTTMYTTRWMLCCC